MEGPARVLPSTPASMKRRCQRQTQGLDTPAPAHDLHRAAAFGRGEDDLCPPDVLLGTVPIRQNGFQPLPITRPKPDLDVAAHARVVQQDLGLRIFCFVQTARQKHKWLESLKSIFGQPLKSPCHRSGAPAKLAECSIKSQTRKSSSIKEHFLYNIGSSGPIRGTSKKCVANPGSCVS